MPRYRLVVEYDGTPYVGWQRQINGPSVQGALETALFDLAGGPVTVFGAGRTDTGVHATHQVCHVDLDVERPDYVVRDAMNARLAMVGELIAVLSAQQVPDSFNARFSATARHYRYLIHQRRPPLTHNALRAWWIINTLDVAAMNEAAQDLLGTHDFTTFRSTSCQAESPVRTLDRLEVVEQPARPGEDWRTLEVHASARSFLHNQVRSLVGSLKLVGEGRWSRARLVEALKARDRQACGTVAPAHGLYFVGVDY